MVYRGTYKNGVVVLEGNVVLPEGQRVTVDPEPLLVTASEPPSTTQKLLELSGIIKDGPPDASVNHDHYLYGAPKRDSNQ